MRHEELTPEWRRLLELLDPIHDETRALARRLAPSLADGDDLFQDALLRAFDRLATLRDEARFLAWFIAVLLSVHRSRSRRAFWRRLLSLDSKRAEGLEPVGEDGNDRADETLRSQRAARGRERLRRYYERLGFGDHSGGPVRRRRRPVQRPAGLIFATGLKREVGLPPRGESK